MLTIVNKHQSNSYSQPNHLVFLVDLDFLIFLFLSSKLLQLYPLGIAKGSCWRGWRPPLRWRLPPLSHDDEKEK